MSAYHVDVSDNYAAYLSEIRVIVIVTKSMQIETLPLHYDYNTSKITEQRAINRVLI